MSQPTPKNVSLFVTCVVDQFFPEVGESTVRVLRRNGIDVDFDPDQTCCGQPAFNTGYWKEARPLAERFLDMYEDVDYVVMPSGSCASMVRVFYQELFHDDPTLLRRAAMSAATSSSCRNSSWTFSAPTVSRKRRSQVQPVVSLITRRVI